MKKLLILIVAILFISCSKGDNNLTGINNDGSGGISCLVDGKILKPSGGGIYGNTTSKLDYLPDEQINILIISFFSRDGGPNRFTSVALYVTDIDINNLQDQTFNLKDENSNESFATYLSGEATSALKPGEEYSTNSAQVGELKILFFDLEARVISGEFWFNAENEFGNIVKVTEGRFDLRI
ncbi:DUF6252 family protein [Salegentibacter sp. Hel_I_6]|uniref:DUF6252 family protein n=1 Tax=Salegentibacter sp. Hel_I_6 TaxID=1250278 RepID=UPI000562639F|nr:DUF6252 family protein [Salegentibacter sp. Hel_I_6]